MVVLLAYYKVRPGVDAEALGAISRRMQQSFARADGMSLTVYEFEDLEGLERWRMDPEHLAPQRRGQEFFEWMRNDVCVVERQDPMGSIPLDTTASRRDDRPVSEATRSTAGVIVDYRRY